MQDAFDSVSQYIAVSVHAYAFDNDAELDCIAIGFGLNEFGQLLAKGFMVNTTIKYGPEACKWPIMYPPNMNWRTFFLINII